MPTGENIPRRGVVGWSRASRNLLVPDHGERMNGRSESDSSILEGGGRGGGRQRQPVSLAVGRWKPLFRAHEDGSQDAAVNRSV